MKNAYIAQKHLPNKDYVHNVTIPQGIIKEKLI
jgi:hypothetical protein